MRPGLATSHTNRRSGKKPANSLKAMVESGAVAVLVVKNRASADLVVQAPTWPAPAPRNAC